MSQIIFRSFFSLSLIFCLLSCSSSDDPDDNSPTNQPNDPSPQEQSNCSASINLQVNEVTGTSADVSWDTVGDYNEFEIEFGEAGFIQGQGSLVSSSTDNLEILDLPVNSELDFYIRGNCGPTTGVWNGPTSIVTPCDQGFYQGDVLITTQEELDAFAALCYTGIEGKLTIESEFQDPEGVTDLSGLVGLTEVKGTVKISTNTFLTSLEGLHGLKKTGAIEIRFNLNLESLTGLRNIEELFDIPNGAGFPRSIIIVSNSALTNLEGLENFTELNALAISSNNLVSLKGIENIQSLNRLDINLEGELQNLEHLSGLTNVSEDLRLFLNNNLISLHGLENLSEIGGLLEIKNNESLTSLEALDGINSVEQLKLEENESITSLNGIDLSSIEVNFQLFNNNSLIDFQQVGGSGPVTTFLEIRDNDSLSSFTGLEMITAVKGLWASNNENLLSTDGLDNILEYEVYIWFQENINLVDYCALTNLVENGSYNNEWHVNWNSYNPTPDDIAAGDCSW